MSASFHRIPVLSSTVLVLAALLLTACPPEEGEWAYEADELRDLLISVTKGGEPGITWYFNNDGTVTGDFGGNEMTLPYSYTKTGPNSAELDIDWGDPSTLEHYALEWSSEDGGDCVYTEGDADPIDDCSFTFGPWGGGSG